MNKKILLALLAIIIIALGVLAYNSFLKEEKSSKLPETACTMDYNPVCGVDGITYGNKCMAGSIEVAYTGECNSVPVDNQMPVEGSNTPEMVVGGTYPVGEVPENLSDEELAAS